MQRKRNHLEPCRIPTRNQNPGRRMGTIHGAPIVLPRSAQAVPTSLLGESPLESATAFAVGGLSGAVRDEAILAGLRASVVSASTASRIANAFQIIGKASFYIGAAEVLLSSPPVATEAGEQQALKANQLRIELLDMLNEISPILEAEIDAFADAEGAELEKRRQLVQAWQAIKELKDDLDVWRRPRD